MYVSHIRIMGRVHYLFIAIRLKSTLIQNDSTCQGIICRRNIRCLIVHGIYVTAINSTTNNVVFFFVSYLKIVYYNNY